jgi:hypothetical protein
MLSFFAVFRENYLKLFLSLHQVQFSMQFKGLLFFFFFTLSFVASTQVKVFDKLEMLYDQGKYKKVLRKTNVLLDNPIYDYSLIPTFYKSVVLFQLSQDEKWLKRNPKSLGQAENLFNKIKSSSDGIKVFEAHIYEVSALKRDLISWSEDLKRSGKRQAFENIQELLFSLFENVPDIEFEGNVEKEEVIAESNDFSEDFTRRKEREQIVNFAKKEIGKPYLWAGNDPKGFDCSGFTSYIMGEIKKEVPRRATEQYEKSAKVKSDQAQKGDLVFFDNGSGISHVGIIVSNKGEPKVMIHASSSKGIVITEIEKSAYWEKRIYGFGTYVTD